MFALIQKVRRIKKIQWSILMHIIFKNYFIFYMHLAFHCILCVASFLIIFKINKCSGKCQNEILLIKKLFKLKFFFIVSVKTYFKQICKK